MHKTNEFRLCSFEGGIAHNAIPTDAIARFSCEDEAVVKSVCDGLFAIFEKKFRATEKDMIISYKKLEPCECEQYFDIETSKKAIHLLNALPHGVFKMSVTNEKTVETSSNLAVVSIKDNSLHILSSQRSNFDSQLEYLTEKIESIATLAGAKVISGKGYPSWEPKMESDFLKKAVLSYKNAFGTEPKINVIHAGLECGIIGVKQPDMQMLSIGPTIHDCHTYHEKMKISDIDRLVGFITELFKNLEK